MIFDLNADLGEGAGTDALLMPWITSANICCGLHAGGPYDTLAALKLAKQHGVVAGAHPGYHDPAHFGRVDQELPDGGCALLDYQLAGIDVLAEAANKRIAYMKLHGALYHRANRDPEVARVCAEMAVRYNWPLVGLAGTELQNAVDRAEGEFIAEGFADRRYRADGSLVPRDQPDALIHDPRECVEQVEWLVGSQQVRTICVHGDTPGAVEFVRSIRGYLLDRGHAIRAFA